MPAPEASGRSRNLIREESGVIAIIVALSISTFLLGFSALAVDLGTAYVRKAELKGMAEKVALAGAAALPTIADALAAAQATLGTGRAGGNPGTGLCADLDLPGVCTAMPGWADNGILSDGEITFYADEGQKGELADQNGDGRLSTLDQVTSSTEAVGIHVLLPPSRVPFGLASAIGFDSADLSQTATARIGTPLGLGILPFGLFPPDLTAGKFCVQDPTATRTNPVAAQQGFAVVLSAPNGTVRAGEHITITLTPFSFLRIIDPASVQFFFQSAPITPVPATNTGFDQFDVTVPNGVPAGTTVQVWATGDFIGGGSFVSYTDGVTYAGAAPGDPCGLQSVRGFVNLARTATGDTFEPNLRSGPEAKLYPTAGPLGPIGTTAGCLTTVLGSPPSTSCLTSVLTQPFSRRMTNGFFTSAGGKPGRLVGDCGGGVDSTRGHSNIDAMTLLDNGSPLLDGSFGSATQLRNRILGNVAPTDAEQGWIRSRALTCPRMAVMPILDPNPLTTVAGARNITGFTYVWIDNTSGTGGVSGPGLTWARSNRLRSFQGYVINPKYLPTLVSGSPVVGPYLGDTMPKEVLLIPDLASP